MMRARLVEPLEHHHFKGRDLGSRLEQRRHRLGRLPLFVLQTDGQPFHQGMQSCELRFLDRLLPPQDPIVHLLTLAAVARELVKAVGTAGARQGVEHRHELAQDLDVARLLPELGEQRVNALQPLADPGDERFQEVMRIHPIHVGAFLSD